MGLDGDARLAPMKGNAAEAAHDRLEGYTTPTPTPRATLAFSRTAVNPYANQ
jgi:hypothetical protein